MGQKICVKLVSHSLFFTFEARKKKEPTFRHRERREAKRREEKRREEKRREEKRREEKRRERGERSEREREERREKSERKNLSNTFFSHTLDPGACKGSQVTINATTGIVTGWVLNLGAISKRFGGVTVFLSSIYSSLFFIILHYSSLFFIILLYSSLFFIILFYLHYHQRTTGSVGSLFFLLWRD
jgi:hypothetical protein